MFQQLRTIMCAVHEGLEFLNTHQEPGPSAFGALQPLQGRTCDLHISVLS